jgi:hypothetical protein
LNVVGAQVRAGGTLQYPTIASMYLEVVFALGVGLVLHTVDRSHRLRAAALLVTLVVIGEGIALTFTRAGWLTMAVTLVIAAVTRMQHRGFDAGFACVVGLAAAIAALLVTSRSTQSLWLRFTTDGQNAWYRAEIEAPATLSMSTNQLRDVPLAVTNAGRSTWDSNDHPPILLSYHWLRAEDDGVVAFEGERTPFDRPVAPGQTTQIRALVRAPQHPGGPLVVLHRTGCAAVDDVLCDSDGRCRWRHAGRDTASATCGSARTAGAVEGGRAHVRRASTPRRRARQFPAPLWTLRRHRRR